VSTALIALAIVGGIYVAVVALLAVIGRRSAARAIAGFIPDCAVMFRRLLARPETLRWERAGLVVLVAYLLSPLDIVPDFIPVAGQLDDAVIVALALAFVLHRHGEAAIRSAWPGPEGSLRVVLRAARTAARGPGTAAEGRSPTL
jgi:uncharacterized membrane protein YkvA (DUF1232 family)